MRRGRRWPAKSSRISKDTQIETDNDRVCAAAMRERLGLELELAAAGEFDSDLNVIASPLQDTRAVFDLMPTEGEDAWRTIATRMAAVPAALARTVGAW